MAGEVHKLNSKVALRMYSKIGNYKSIFFLVGHLSKASSRADHKSETFLSR